MDSDWINSLLFNNVFLPAILSTDGETNISFTINFSAKSPAYSIPVVVGSNSEVVAFDGYL